MFDSHCHLDFAAFDDDRDDVIARSLQNGVTAIHVPGVGPDQWAKAAALQHHPGIGSGVGIHPQWLARLSPDALQRALDDLEPRARTLNAEAIGEVGLDAPTAKKGPSIQAQVAVLDAHLEVARAIDLPIVLHVFGPHGKALETLKRHGPLPAGGEGEMEVQRGVGGDHVGRARGDDPATVAELTAANAARLFRRA